MVVALCAVSCSARPEGPVNAPVNAPGNAPGTPPVPPPAPPIDRRVDEHSYAEPARVRVKRLRLDLTADFGAKQLAGTATLALEWLGPASRLVLDTRDLRIDRVEVPGERGAWRAVPFALGKRDPILGSPLTITLDGAHPEVRIAYRTAPAASGLQWLAPALTADGKHPMLFTQSQAIHARSWVPLQDTPGVRFTYEARIRTPKELVAVMSADNDPAVVRDGDYGFEMPQPIPSYLLALAIGDLAFKPFSARAGVWAERSVVDRAAAEFADTEKMIGVAEGLYGPYRWGRYDLLILPPSFPYGGMENPRISFITPTVIVGDRSLVSMIAHELAHSWSGNLVTNATWKDLWLNEGFTMYVESRITEAVYGKELADMEVVIRQRELRAQIEREPAALQRLRLGSLAGLDPDDAGSIVSYSKGQWFLRTLEQRFGRAELDAFLRRWFDRNAFQSVTTDDLEAALRAELIGKRPEALSDAELAAWLDGAGIPASAVAATSQRLAAVDAARASWLANGGDLARLGAARWSTQERAHFLDGLPRTLARPQLAALDAALGLTRTGNGELAMRWYPLAIRSGHAEARPAIAAFLERVGRQRLVMPVYRALAETPDGLAFARATFARARPGYHPITAASVEALLAAPPAPPAPPSRR
ncbi:MAG TPA: leukotriene A4 hydrolase C-terminal domain-containing protein [Kofleriaceae bacterium]|nr:leukotriene A4 hydrolase C-terminal domain-containing protein [Kofleriaceae bacterium]